MCVCGGGGGGGRLVSKSPGQQKGIVCGVSCHSCLLLYGSFCPLILPL